MVGKKIHPLPRISDYSSRKEWEQACWRTVYKQRGLTEALLTSYERRNLVMRAAVMHGLASGKKTGQIAKELWSSRQTISSIRNSLEKGGYRSYRQRSGRKEGKRTHNDSGGLSPRKPHRPRGRPVRTKYGTIYIPNS